MATTLNQETFLVRIDAGRYVIDTEIGRTEIEITNVLSFARHSFYSVADGTAQRLRRRGFRAAVVTDYLGSPITDDDVRSILSAEREHENRLPANQAELDAISTCEIRRRTKTEVGFRERVAEIETEALR